MLPGFRFLIATLLLMASVVVFGLGATALFRATRDDLAARPATWDAPEAVVARERDTRKATLALLRVEMIADQDSNLEKQAALAAAAPSLAEGGTAAEATPGPALEADRMATVSDSVPAKAVEGAAMAVASVEPSASSAGRGAGLGASLGASLGAAVGASDVPQPAKPELTVTALADPAAASAEVAARPAAKAAKPSVTSASKARAEAAKRVKARQAAAQRRRIALRARALAQQPRPQTMPPGNPFAGFGG